jgi:ADP-glucose pyrophosphorylase
MRADTLAIILGGGAGSRLFPLTATRSKPAVPIGGKYRLIDVPISGCLHAEIRRIFVLTQFNSASLNRHISSTYRLDPFSAGSSKSWRLNRRPTTRTGSRARPTRYARRCVTLRSTTRTVISSSRAITSTAWITAI